MRDSKFEKARKRALKVNQQNARRFCAAMTRKSRSRNKGRRLGESLQFETVLPARTRIYRQATAECSARSLVLGAATLCKRCLESHRCLRSIAIRDCRPAETSLSWIA